MGEQGAMGIYLDDGSQNLTVHHNVVYLNNHSKIVRGIWFHGNFGAQSDIFAYNNTCYGLHGTEWNQAVAAYNRKGSYTNMVFRNNLSDTKAFINGTDMQANSGAAAPSYFVDVAKVNFRLTRDATEAIDQGVEISGITDGSAGSKPDIGAYELSGRDWHAGSTVAAPSFPAGK